MQYTERTDYKEQNQTDLVSFEHRRTVGEKWREYRWKNADNCNGIRQPVSYRHSQSKGLSGRLCDAKIFIMQHSRLGENANRGRRRKLSRVLPPVRLPIGKMRIMK